MFFFRHLQAFGKKYVILRQTTMPQPMKAPLAIVVPVYNRAHIVERTLQSIARQTLRPLHVIVVNNNSTDNTAAVLQNWQKSHNSSDLRIDVIDCGRRGAAAARNAGLALVTEPYVMFFDSDDIMLPEHCELLCRNLAHADLVGRDVELYIDGAYVKTLPFFGTDMQWNNLFHGAMATQRWAASTDLVRRAGGWNENIHYWDDIELGARMLALAPQLRRIEGCGVRVNYTPESITGRADADPSRALAPLAAIEQTLAPVTGKAKAHRWAALKAAVEFGLCARAGSKAGSEAFRNMARTTGMPLSARAAYALTRMGLPGAARLLKPFIH